MRRTKILAAIGVLNPVILLPIGLARLLRSIGVMKVLFFLSVLGNLAFLTLVIVALLSDSERGSSKSLDHALVGAIPPGFIVRDQGPLYFCELANGNDSANLISNRIYVASESCAWAEFEFMHPSDKHPRVVAINNSACQSVLAYNLLDGSINITRFGADGQVEESLRDENGDGIPDRRINWRDNSSYVRTGSVTWEKVNARTDMSID